MKKRICCILLCLVPLPVTILLQLLVSVPVFGVTTIASVVNSYYQGMPYQAALDELFSVWSSSTFIVAASMTYAVAALLLFGVWYWKKLADGQEFVPASSAFNWQIVASFILLAVGLQYIVQYLMSFIGTLRPDWMHAYAELADSAGFGTLSPLLLFYSCIIAPVSEELIFRGVAFGYAKKAMPLCLAICLQAVLFGIFHMNIIQGIYAAFLGLFLGYVCEESGTIAAAILFHAVFNLCGTFFNPYMYYHMEQPFFFLLWLTVGVLLTYAGIFLFQHGTAVRDMD